MFKIIIAICSIAMVSQPLFACDKENNPCTGSEVIKRPPVNMEEEMNKMTPVFGNMVQSMMAGRFEALANPKVTEQLAKFSKRYYDALINEGFTDQQALQIVIAVGVPSAQ